MTAEEKIEAIRKLIRYDMEMEYDWDASSYAVLEQYDDGDLLKYDDVLEIINS